MPAPFSILTLDLHNTIYDEVMEYGLAINEAIHAWAGAAGHHGVSLVPALLHKELAAAHCNLGSDWDGEVWKHLPSLKSLPLDDIAFNKMVAQAEKLRADKSRELMRAGLYSGVRETLAALKARGVRIFIITEAAGDMAMQAALWLGLEELVDGIYSYPSVKKPLHIPGIFHSSFPPGPDEKHLKKPHPYLLATVILAEAIRSGKVPEGTRVDNCFSLAESDLPSHKTACHLVFKETEYAQDLRRIQDSILYVGDSKFKDGMLAQNAGVVFGFAAYGKHIKPGQEVLHRQSLDIMYAVTGWEVETLKLTQESARSAAIDAITPDFTFTGSLTEALPLFI